MRDFLIDTNIWEYWFNEKKQPQHANVLRRVHELEMKEGGQQSMDIFHYMGRTRIRLSGAEGRTGIFGNAFQKVHF